MATLGFQAYQKQIEFSSGLVSGVFVCLVQTADEAFQILNLAPRFKLRRETVRIFEYPISHPQLVRHQRIALQFQRPALPRQIFKRALPKGIRNALFHQLIEPVQCPRSQYGYRSTKKRQLTTRGSWRAKLSAI